MTVVSHRRAAMTLLEVIFVIVILGIVSSIGASVIANVYEGYITQRAQYNANYKTEMALTQIANRLKYAIPGTVGVRATKTGSFTPITEIGSTATRNVLQWVGADGDSFEAINSSSSTGTARRPGWSSFCDIDASTNSNIVTPGSYMELTTEIISNLGSSISSARLFFPDGSSYPISSGNGENIVLASAIPSGNTIFERYKLAWSSYAVVFEGTNLWLYHHFSPAYGAPLGQTKNLLLSNVTSFSFKGSEGSMWIKVCQYEYMETNNLANAARSCKEKIILY